MNLLRRVVLILAVLLILTVPGVYPQGSADTPTLEQARALMMAQDYTEAAAAYEKIVTADPQNAAAWMQLGSLRHMQKDYPGALEAWERAEALGYALPQTRYNLACAAALSGNSDAAFKWLEKADDAGFGNTKLLESDSDLNSLRDDPRFKEVTRAAERNARPCEYDPRYSQFDFWVGDWAVFGPSERRVGTSHVSKILNGCTLLEEWSSPYGVDGKSINYYDPHANKWYQTWISASGDILRYEGKLVGGAMHFEGKGVNLDGSTELSRMTFTPLEDGEVRQFIERSTDNGATWSVFFDGTYVPATARLGEK